MYPSSGWYENYIKIITYHRKGVNHLCFSKSLHVYKNIELNNDSISFNFSCSDLSFHIIFNLDKSAIACPILAFISVFDPLSSMIAPKYLNVSIMLSG